MKTNDKVTNSTRVPTWSSKRVSDLLKSSTTVGGPKYLDLGKWELLSLLKHLEEAFGKDALAAETNELYYMGLKVRLVGNYSHISVSGKRNDRLNVARKDNILDLSSSLWSFKK